MMTPVKYTPDCKSRGYENADFMLRPNLKGFRATDVSKEAMSRMFELGYEEAKSNMENLKKAISQNKRKRK